MKLTGACVERPSVERCAHMKRKTYLKILAIFCVLLASSCGGASGAGVSEDVRKFSAFQSLRLGQITTLNNRVATTVAIDTREAVVILSFDPSNPSLADVLYRTGDGRVAQITIDADGRPLSAVAEGYEVSFTEFQDGTVSVSSVATSEATQVEVESDVLGLLKRSFVVRSSGQGLSPQASFEKLFQVAVVAVRTFGCASIKASGQISLDSSYLQVAESACRSRLIDTLLTYLKAGGIDERLISNFQGDPIACSFERGNFQGARDCILNSSNEAIIEALLSVPDLEAVLNGTFNPDTGEIIVPTPPEEERPSSGNSDDGDSGDDEEEAPGDGTPPPPPALPDPPPRPGAPIPARR